MWVPDTPIAMVPLWQLLQLVTDCCVWFQVEGRNDSWVAEWHCTQFNAVVMWVPPGLPVAVVPLWHVVQSVAAVNWAWLGLAPVHALVLWQDSQPLTTPVCTDVDGFAVNPYNAVRWQLSQDAVTEILICKRPGNQLV
jgi:hypothetical protein